MFADEEDIEDEDDDDEEEFGLSKCVSHSENSGEIIIPEDKIQKKTGKRSPPKLLTQREKALLPQESSFRKADEPVKEDDTLGIGMLIEALKEGPSIKRVKESNDIDLKKKKIGAPKFKYI